MMTEEKCLQTVLVVDDEPLVLKYTTSVISGLGYKKVLKAHCAQEADSDRRLLLSGGEQLVSYHGRIMSPRGRAGGSRLPNI